MAGKCSTAAGEADVHVVEHWQVLANMQHQLRMTGVTAQTASGDPHDIVRGWLLPACDQCAGNILTRSLCLQILAVVCW